MAASQSLYPRGTVKRIVKAHSNRPLSKNADILVSTFSAHLVKEAAVKSRQNGERTISARTVRKVREV
ncbi:hypothetical protein NA57DRAFT_15326, partial [Rhizodiscina lignyota]